MTAPVGAAPATLSRTRGSGSAPASSADDFARALAGLDSAPEHRAPDVRLARTSGEQGGAAALEPARGHALAGTTPGSAADCDTAASESSAVSGTSPAPDAHPGGAPAPAVTDPALAALALSPALAGLLARTSAAAPQSVPPTAGGPGADAGATAAAPDAPVLAVLAPAAGTSLAVPTGLPGSGGGPSPTALTATGPVPPPAGPAGGEPTAVTSAAPSVVTADAASPAAVPAASTSPVATTVSADAATADAAAAAGPAPTTAAPAGTAPTSASAAPGAPGAPVLAEATSAPATDPALDLLATTLDATGLDVTSSTPPAAPLGSAIAATPSPDATVPAAAVTEAVPQAVTPTATPADPGPARVDASPAPGTQGLEQVQAPATTPDARTGAAPAAAPAPAPPPPPAAQVAQLLGPVLEGPDGAYSLSLQLYPEELGAVQVEVLLRGGEIRLALHAGDPAAQSALRAAVPDLRADLQAGGLTASSVSVDGGRSEQPPQDRSPRRSPAHLPHGGGAGPSVPAVRPATSSSDAALDLRM